LGGQGTDPASRRGDRGPSWRREARRHGGTMAGPLPHPVASPSTRASAATGPERDGSADEPPSLVPGTPPDRDPQPRQTTRTILEVHPDDGEGVRHLNRELSWLQFDERVLAIAEDPELPLLERAKFLAIFAGNLDEFFQVRVAGTARAGRGRGHRIRRRRGAARRPAAGHRRVRRGALPPRRGAVPRRGGPGARGARHPPVRLARARRRGPRPPRAIFEEQVFPVLTPLAVDPAHPFPYISNLSLNLAVVVRDPDDGEQHFARVKVPRSCPGSWSCPTANGSSPSSRSSPRTSTGCSPAGRSSSTTPSGSPATPTSRSRRRRPTTCCSRSSPS
jgi:polyphosphate kinase